MDINLCLRVPERNQPVMSLCRNDPHVPFCEIWSCFDSAAPRQPPLVLNGPFDIYAPRLVQYVLSVYERLPGVNFMGSYPESIPISPIT